MLTMTRARSVSSADKIASSINYPRACVVCKSTHGPLWYCVCNPRGPFHDACSGSLQHHNVSGAGGPASMWSVPSNCEVFPFKRHLYMLSLFTPPRSSKEKKLLHLHDLQTTWFGARVDSRGALSATFSSPSLPNLYMWGRVQALLDNAKDPPSSQYPSLVSFIGDTGAGKSTLIGSLIRLLAPEQASQNLVPVPAAFGDDYKSTSSDVHLYADPKTLSSSEPILFAGEHGPTACFKSLSPTDEPV